MKKLMLIGDSIRMNYQNSVAKELEGEFEVWGSEENNRFAKYTLNELARMLNECSQHKTDVCQELLTPTADLNENIVYPDVIHWNNGLWDTSIVYEEDGAFTPVDEYIAYMSKILRELRKITDKIIFATTTPVKPQNPNQKNDIITDFNKRIIEFMKKENVMINDLNAVVNSNLDEFLAPDNIHLSETGKSACGKAVADCVRKIAKD